MLNSPTFNNLEHLAGSGDAEKVFEALRQLPLKDLGELLLDADRAPSALRNILPRMASDEVQRNWTGTSGHALLKQSLSFVETVASTYASITGKPLDGARILDYGCGWGRLIRLMYKFSSPTLIYGCDAWDMSLDLCKKSGILAHLDKCEEVPVEAPFPGTEFDLIYAFSVFTHLSERTAKAVMSSLRRRVSPDGLAVITIRPLKYWDAHDPSQNLANIAKMKQSHLSYGYAFTPHVRAPIDGDITYGDTSMTVDYIAKNWAGWSVATEKSNAADPYQQLVFLKPV